MASLYLSFLLSNFDQFYVLQIIWSIDVICLYCGTKKTEPVKEFLSQFLDELKELPSTGFTLNWINYKVTLNAITSDAPARSFLKCNAGHASYHGCESCTIKGGWMQVKLHKMTKICMKQEQMKHLANCTTMITRKRKSFYSC